LLFRVAASVPQRNALPGIQIVPLLLQPSRNVMSESEIHVVAAKQ
jgi:hypothetical protein